MLFLRFSPRPAAILSSLGLMLLFACGFAAPLYSAPRALPEGTKPADRRLEPLKDLNGYFPMAVPASPSEWEQRANLVRRQMLISQGLWPMPTKIPLKPVIHGAIDQGDYTVEKVYFESMPGFYVTGNLYRPKGKQGKQGKLAGVLCPHGHWQAGRFYDNGVENTKLEVSSGGEKFEDEGRSPLQSRCVQLARMGCVVFFYDMIGYADSQQIPGSISHGFSKQRPQLNTTENWGLFSPQAETHLQSAMGLQTFNSIRALDFITSLPEVDPSRIGVTGASGGGTQTFMLCALDPRPAAAFPAVMVSTAMQGGCTCENASLLRIGTGNIEFAGLFAPKPLGLSAANDWTKEMTTKGFPELQQLYQLLGAKENVFLISRLEYGHNYNYVSRMAMYHWFNEHLHLGVEEKFDEQPFKRLSTEQLTVWNDEHPRPESGEEFERKLLRWWHEDSEKKLAEVYPKDSASLARFREIAGQAMDGILARRLPEAAALEYDQREEQDGEKHHQMVGLLRNVPQGEEIPVAFLLPHDWNGRVVIWLTDSGKQGLFDGERPNTNVQRLLDAGICVAGADLLYQGEFLTDGNPLTKTEAVQGNDRQAAAYTFGYNHTVFAKRVHDVLTLIGYIKSHERQPKQIDLVAFGNVAPIVAAARMQAGTAIDCAAIETAGMRFGKLLDIHDPNFLPGGARYGDLPGMLALAAPGRTWIAGETGDSLALTSAAYASANAAEQLTTHAGNSTDTVPAAVQWILSQGK